jgi:hypothetical protein
VTELAASNGIEQPNGGLENDDAVRSSARLFEGRRRLRAQGMTGYKAAWRECLHGRRL